IVAMKNGQLFATGTTSEMMTKEVLDPLYEMDIRICEVEGKRFCLYFSE
ncbi:MAG: iron ABC transporter ATP-binding protein, partial [Carnobacterium sp.]